MVVFEVLVVVLVVLVVVVVVLVVVAIAALWTPIRLLLVFRRRGCYFRKPEANIGIPAIQTLGHT